MGDRDKASKVFTFIRAEDVAILGSNRQSININRIEIMAGSGIIHLIKMSCNLVYICY